MDQKEYEEEGTFYMETKKIMDSYNINIEEIAEMGKEKLKGIVKEKIEDKMTKNIEKATNEMKKLRFIKAEKFKRQQ